jgi:hypothetical protein
LPADALGTLSCKPSNFGENVRKVIHQVKWRVVQIIKWGVKWSAVILCEMKLKRGKLWCGSEGYEVAVKWNEWRVMA